MKRKKLPCAEQVPSQAYDPAVPLRRFKPLTTMNSGAVYASTPAGRVDAIRQGVAATDVRALIQRMNLSQDRFFRILRLSPATVNRKAQSNARLSIGDSERVIGVAQLIGQVEAMVAESGEPDQFDAASWLALWIDTPLPALAGQKPADYLDTMEGQKLVSNLLAMMQSGAYA